MFKFDLKANHGVNILLIALGVLIVFYNHYRSGSTTPLTLDSFAALVPMIGQYLTSIKAHAQESPVYITARQLLTILDMAKERGLDARHWAAEHYNTRLDVITRKQATQMILKLKKIPRLETDNEHTEQDI